MTALLAAVLTGLVLAAVRARVAGRGRRYDQAVRDEALAAADPDVQEWRRLNKQRREDQRAAAEQTTVGQRVPVVGGCGW